MVPAPSTFLPAIPSQVVAARLTIVKSKQEYYKQKSDQQHGLKSCHLLVLGAKYFALEMKALKDDCERFEIFPLGHIYSSKSN